jgi:3-hydroxyisobutyrate dehydrogenase
MLGGHAAVAELVYAPDSSPGVREDVWVRVPPAASTRVAPEHASRAAGEGTPAPGLPAYAPGEPAAMTTVAVLGTGLMGAPMARNLLSAGLAVHVWNRTEEKARALADDGAEPAATPAAAAAGAAVVVTMLSDGDATQAAMQPPDGALAGLAPGAVWAQMGTLGLDGTDACAALAAEHGVTFVDAPVLGTKQPAEQGALVVLASGPDEARDAVTPLFEAVGSRTLWLGEAGAGTRLKLVANTWVLALAEGLGESFALAERFGLDPQAFLDAIAGGPLDSAYAKLKGGAMMARTFPPAFPLRLAAKDARLIVEAARTTGLELPLVQAVAAQFAAGVEGGHGDEDLAATFSALLGE